MDEVSQDTVESLKKDLEAERKITKDLRSQLEVALESSRKSLADWRSTYQRAREVEGKLAILERVVIRLSMKAFGGNDGD